MYTYANTLTKLKDCVAFLTFLNSDFLTFFFSNISLTDKLSSKLQGKHCRNHMTGIRNLKIHCTNSRRSLNNLITSLHCRELLRNKQYLALQISND